MLFSLNSDMSCPFFILDSEEVLNRGTVEISDAEDWEFSVPPQALLLRAGLWYWSFRVTAADESVTEIDVGIILVKP